MIIIIIIIICFLNSEIQQLKACSDLKVLFRFSVTLCPPCFFRYCPSALLFT